MRTNTKTIQSRVKGLTLFIIISMTSSLALMSQTAMLSLDGISIDESLITVKNNKLIFNGLSPSQEDDGYSIIGIMGNASKGEVKVVDGAQIEYNPMIDICDKRDVFSYLISNGSTEAVRGVSVEILCETFAVLSSITPNGDGQQDNFVILGIENYPDNELVIFNDLGLEIYKRKNYGNDWDGSYQGKTLPAGVYYYVFNPGNEKVISGYLHMGETS